MVIFSFTGRKGYSSIFSSTHKEEKGREGKGRKEKGRKGKETKEKKRREGRWGGRPRARWGRKEGRQGRNCRDTPWLPLVVQRETAPRPPLQRVEGAPTVGQARCGGGGQRWQTMPSAGRRSPELRGGHSGAQQLSLSCMSEHTPQQRPRRQHNAHTLIPVCRQHRSCRDRVNQERGLPHQIASSEPPSSPLPHSFLPHKNANGQIGNHTVIYRRYAINVFWSNKYESEKSAVKQWYKLDFKSSQCSCMNNTLYKILLPIFFI